MAGIMMPYMAVAGQGGFVLPNQIPNLNLWYDASVSNAAFVQNSSGLAPSSGQTIRSWLDKLGFGRDANQSNSNKQPTWLANQQNGLGALQFDGAGDTLTLNPIAWSLSLPGQTTFVVFKLNGQADQMHIQSTNTGGFAFNLSGTSWAVETAGALAVSGQGSDTTNYHYMGMIFDGTQTNANVTTQNNDRIKFRFDGAQQALTFATNANATTSPTANTLNVGADDNGNAGYLNGLIGEIMIWTRTLSAVEITQVENYLKNKWGITPSVTNNLILSYDPSVSTSYSGSGTTINSLASPNLTGAMSNITYTNPYFTFNGSNSTVNVSDNALLEPGTGDFTVEAWVYHNTITGSSRVIVGKTDNGGLASSWGYGIRTNSAGSTYLEVGNGTTSVTSPSAVLTTGRWYQVVGVWNNVSSDTISFYVNGALIGSNPHSFTSIKNTVNPLYLGSYNGGEFSQWLNGRIGVTRLYNKALTASEILQNYNSTKSKYGL